MKKHILIAYSLFALFLSSCDKELVVTSISLDKTTLELSQGAVAQIVATIQPATIPLQSTLGTVQWSSSNTAVATVAGGKVTAVSVGTAQIVATAGSVTSTCNVTVSAAINSITLNKTVSVLLVDSTLTLAATLLPASTSAVSANLIWTSTNPSVVSVDNNGKVTAISTGTANIVASIGTVTAVCSVSVLTSIANSLMGSDYYLINIDASDANVIGSDKIAADYRPDGVNSNLFVWSNTYNTGTCIGPNFYGITANWLSLVVGSVGWSGAAYNVTQGAQLDKLKAVTDDPSGKFYLHFAIKSSSTNSYEFQLGYGASAAIIVLGPNSMDNVAPSGNFTRNGQWQEVEIPISVFKAKGLSYTTGMASTNVFAMLAGGTAGTKLEIDAVFIYKKP